MRLLLNGEVDIVRKCASMLQKELHKVGIVSTSSPILEQYDDCYDEFMCMFQSYVYHMYHSYNIYVSFL